MKLIWKIWFASFLTAWLVVPPFAYLICYGISESHSGQAIPTLLAQYLQSRRNPLLTALLSIIPFALLALITWLFKRRRASEKRQVGAMLGGGVAIVLVMLWANLSYWPHFLPGVSYPGFPHGLELVIAPLFFAPVAAILGAIIGGILANKQ